MDSYEYADFLARREIAHERYESAKDEAYRKARRDEQKARDEAMFSELYLNGQVLPYYPEDDITAKRLVTRGVAWVAEDGMLYLVTPKRKASDYEVYVTDYPVD